MSKQMWVEQEGVFMEELAQVVRDKGCVNMIHNCGERIYFDVQIDTVQPLAISFMHPADDCESYAHMKEKYGDKVILIGAVTPAKALVGTDEDWDKECTDQIDAMAKGGGYILATGCEYPSNAPFDRAYRMIDIAKNYGKYK